MKRWNNQQTDELCEAFLSLQTKEECYAFLEDVCTIKEINDMTQRLYVAKLLKTGMSYVHISEVTGASTATISRISKCLEYGSSGYNTVIERTKKGEENV